MAVSRKRAAKTPEAAPRPSAWQQGTLLWLVFSCGVAVMALEMTASRLLAPYFGSTISVWTCLIGLVMIFLTAGYYLGGLLADRRPSREVLGVIVLAAGLVMLAIPLVGAAVLTTAWKLTPRFGLLASCLAGTCALFLIPNVLLGCVCPYAMKLSLQDLHLTGRAAGRIYAISAVGSVIGTFLPRLFTIELLGVRHSIMLFGAVLVVAALLLLARLRFAPAAGALLLFAVPFRPLLPVPGLLAERESPYNYLQVIDAHGTRLLIVDWGAFSFYTPGEFRTHQYYDYLLLAPLLRPDPPRQWLRRVLVIGLGAGTVAKQITQAYGPVPIDGIEIDPDIVELGRRYFDMHERNLHVFTTDGRAFLASTTHKYDYAIVDAYQGSDIPFQLVTQEFFRQLKAHLRPGGVVAINVCWYEPDDTELLQRLTATLRTVFPTVCAVTHISRQSGAVLLAGGATASPKSFIREAIEVGHLGLLDIAREMAGRDSPRLEIPAGVGAPLTDDRALVDELVDRMYLKTRRDAFARERKVLGL